MANAYSCGDFSIERGPYGYDHGLAWGIWRNKQLVDSMPTLKRAKVLAESLGASGQWVREPAKVRRVE